MEGLRFGVAATYRCNLACRYCNRHLNELPWPDSDVSVEDVKRAGDLVCDLDINKVRITGGEPTLHQNLVEICGAVRDHWRPHRCIVVLTNHTIQGPDLSQVNARYSWDQPLTKQESHRPWMISPADLGLEPACGFNGKSCWVQHGCGRLFDAYGFSFCVLAGALGRVLNIDPYSPEPVTNGKYEICRHCICSLSRRRQWQLWDESSKGFLEVPTRTYTEGMSEFRKSPVSFKRFEER